MLGVEAGGHLWMGGHHQVMNDGTVSSAAHWEHVISSQSHEEAGAFLLDQQFSTYLPNAGTP